MMRSSIIAVMSVALFAAPQLDARPQLSGPSDLVEIDGRTYVREERMFGTARVTLGEEFARVRRPPGQSGTCLAPADTYYQLKVGTPLYRIDGHDPRTLVAVARDRIYGVSVAPGARRGADLLDLSVGLELIYVDEGLRSDVVSIRDPAILASIARAIADAPLTERAYQREHVVTFETRDGILLERGLTTTVLGPGIVPPPQLIAAVDAALRASAGVPLRP